MLSTTIVPFLLKSGLICSEPWRSGMIGGAQLVKPRIPLPIIRRLRIMQGTMISDSQALGFLTGSEILKPEREINRRPLTKAEPSINESSAIRKDTLSTGISVTPVISAMHLNLPVQRRTYMEVYSNEMLLSISYARWKKICRTI